MVEGELSGYIMWLQCVVSWVQVSRPPGKSQLSPWKLKCSHNLWDRIQSGVIPSWSRHRGLSRCPSFTYSLTLQCPKLCMFFELLIITTRRVHGKIPGCTILGEVHPVGAQNKTLILDTEYV